MMKKTLICMACAAAMAAPVANAEISANIGVTSDYIWRGMTQTGHEAAVSGGLDYAHESGFYAGVWASSLGGGAHEIDGYFGLSGEMGKVGYDVGYIYYGYTNVAGADFSEIYGSLSYDWLSGGIHYTVDGDAPSGAPFTSGDIYYYAAASFDLEKASPQFKDWSLAFTVGHYDFDAGSVFDYTHTQLDLSKSVGDFGDITLSVANEDLFNDTSVAVSWSKTF
jgi:uncharacterized protein (TIGR02001 family)